MRLHMKGYKILLIYLFKPAITLLSVPSSFFPEWIDPGLIVLQLISAPHWYYLLITEVKMFEAVLLE